MDERERQQGKTGAGKAEAIRCRSMAEVRAGIDALDRQIVPLLCRRGTYVAEAARLKARREAVVDPERIEAIIARVRDLAGDEAFDPETIERIYRAMIDAYIAFEFRRFDADRKAGGSRADQDKSGSGKGSGV